MALVDTIDQLPVTLSKANEFECSLLDIMDQLLELLKINISVERILIPILEVIAFLFDAQILQRLIGTSFKYVSISP
jgi:hypothetical protein